MPQERLAKKRPIAVNGPIFGGYVGKKPTATRAWPDAHLLATAGMKRRKQTWRPKRFRIYSLLEATPHCGILTFCDSFS